MWSSYGTHIENSDPLYGGGEIVSDFEPSQQEKNEYGLIIFFSLLIRALFGVIGAKTKEDKIKEEVDHIRQLNGQIALQKEQKIKKK